jgi:DNA-binding NarL/FixJ family response regulator
MSDEDDRITILLVDDHALVREGLREILQMQDDMRVVGEAEDSAATVALAAAEQPDIVLLDIEIPGGEVTATVKQIRSLSPASRVIILSMYEGPQLVQTLLAAGIRGYLLKSSHWQELVVANPALPRGSPTALFSACPGKAWGTSRRDRPSARCPPANLRCSTWSRWPSATARSRLACS